MATTLATVLEQVRTTIKALTPSTIPAVVFEERPDRKLGLREWALSNRASPILRKFEVLRSGNARPASGGGSDPDAVDLVVPVTVIVTYPASVAGLYGAEYLDDVEDVAYQDALQIAAALYSPANYVDGQHAFLGSAGDQPDVADLDRGDPDVWVQAITGEVRYLQARSFS